MATKPALDIFTGSENLGTIFKEQNGLTVKFSEFNIPRSDSSGRAATNQLGKTRIQLLQGAHDGTGFAGASQEIQLKNFIVGMEGWVNFNGVNSEQVYTDSFGRTYVVDAVDWTWIRSFDDPFRILYTLMMKETS